MDYRRVKVLKKLQLVFENEFGIEFFQRSNNSGEGVRLKQTKWKRPGTTVFWPYAVTTKRHGNGDSLARYFRQQRIMVGAHRRFEAPVSTGR
jgi:hypothetical protein